MARTVSRLVVRAGPPAAVAYVAVSALTIAGSVALAPWFDPIANALSDLGAAGRATAPVFNGGLALGGLLGAVVGGWLAVAGRGAVRLGGLALVTTMCLRAGIGLFPVGTALHTPIAVAYFLGLAASLLVIGLGSLRATRAASADEADAVDTPGASVAAGVLAVAGGKLVVLVWLSWGLWWRSAVPGLAVPEVVSSLGLLAWLLVLARTA